MKSKKYILYVQKTFCADKVDKNEFKLYHKVRDHFPYSGKFRGAAHSNCKLKHKTSKEISVVFHNGSKYDYHFIIKQLAKEFDGQFECLRKYRKIYYFFSTN